MFRRVAMREIVCHDGSRPSSTVCRDGGGKTAPAELLALGALVGQLAVPRFVRGNRCDGARTLHECRVERMRPDSTL